MFSLIRVLDWHVQPSCNDYVQELGSSLLDNNIAFAVRALGVLRG